MEWHLSFCTVLRQHDVADLALHVVCASCNAQWTPGKWYQEVRQDVTPRGKHVVTIQVLTRIWTRSLRLKCPKKLRWAAMTLPTWYRVLQIACPDHPAGAPRCLYTLHPAWLLRQEGARTEDRPRFLYQPTNAASGLSHLLHVLHAR